MAYPSLTLSFEDQLTLHLQEITATLNSQNWQRAPVLDWLSKNSEPYKGGKYIGKVIEDNYTPTGDAFQQGSILPVSAHNIAIEATYTMTYVQEDAFFDGIKRDEIMVNGDMGPVLNWIDASLKNRGNAIRENMANFLTAATTGTAADGSARPTSIFDIVAASGTIGNVSPTGHSYWASQVDTVSGAWTSTGLTRFRKQLRLARRYMGMSGPTALFCSGTTHDAVLQGGLAKTTYMRRPEDGSAKGPDVGDGKWNWTAQAPYDPNFFIDDIPCWYDPHLDALESSALSTGGILLGLNPDAVHLVESPTMKYRVEPFRFSEQRHATYTRILWGGQNIAINRSANLLLTNIL